MSMTVTASYIYGFPLPDGANQDDVEDRLEEWYRQNRGGRFCTEVSGFDGNLTVWVCLYDLRTYDCKPRRGVESADVHADFVENLKNVAAEFGVAEAHIGWWIVSSYQ